MGEMLQHKKYIKKIRIDAKILKIIALLHMTVALDPLRHVVDVTLQSPIELYALLVQDILTAV